MIRQHVKWLDKKQFVAQKKMRKRLEAIRHEKRVQSLWAAAVFSQKCAPSGE